MTDFVIQKSILHTKIESFVLAGPIIQYICETYEYPEELAEARLNEYIRENLRSWNTASNYEKNTIRERLRMETSLLGYLLEKRIAEPGFDKVTFHWTHDEDAGQPLGCDIRLFYSSMGVMKDRSNQGGIEATSQV